MAMDDRMRHAADDLRRDLAASTDLDATLLATRAKQARLPGRRGPILAIAALIVLVAAIVGPNMTKGEDRVGIDTDPKPAGTPLRLLGPRDGKDSIRLPIVVTPATELEDGTSVTVSGDGFIAGESVGIVQCGVESGGEIRAGADACNIGRYVSVTADANGHASGSFIVQRALTTPYTGTIDCAEADRCLIGMGAIGDYDRSGGFGIDILSTGPVPVAPSIHVSPTEGLGDGDLVRITGEGFPDPDVPPGEVGTGVSISVCSTDPASCWTTGADETGTTPIGPDGTLDVEVPVWRFLPGSEPGTYVDCAASPCSIRVQGVTAPPPVALHFTTVDPAPRAPGLRIEPDGPVHSGDQVTVVGSGFHPGSHVQLAFCATQVDTDNQACPISTDGNGYRVDDDGGFRTELRVTDRFDPLETCMSSSEDCVQLQPSCSDGWTCAIQAYTYIDGPSPARPTFESVPLPVRFAPG